MGVYRFKTERNDPILAGLPDRTYFVEYHHDEVLLPALPSGVYSLLEPDGIEDAIQRPAYDMGASAVAPGAEAQTFGHRPVLAPEERSRAQALRYAVPPAGRLLYSMQFHPDLVWRSSAPQARHAQEHSRLLFSNFLDLADAYWNQ